MIETLKAYCADIEFDLTPTQVIDKLGGITSKYYQICQLMTQMYLLGNPNKKRRGLFLTGVANSGKATIANFINNIFECHSLRQTSSGFQEKMSRKEPTSKFFRSMKPT